MLILLMTLLWNSVLYHNHKMMCHSMMAASRTHKRLVTMAACQSSLETIHICPQFDTSYWAIVDQCIINSIYITVILVLRQTNMFAVLAWNQLSGTALYHHCWIMTKCVKVNQYRYQYSMKISWGIFKFCKFCEDLRFREINDNTS